MILKDKVAIVTGAGQGIGEAIALALSEAGATVVAVDIDAARAEAVARRIEGHQRKALAIAADVGDVAGIDRMVRATTDAFGHIDILVNNAGVTRRADIMELTETMVAWAVEQVLGTLTVSYQGSKVDFTPPWRRLGLVEAIVEHARVEPEELQSEEPARRACERLGLPADPELQLSTMVNNIFERFVQPTLISPTFVTDYPTPISPLAKARSDCPELAERFEPFAAGMELGNAFSELNDPEEQRRRFEQQARSRAAGDDEAHPMDNDFLLALEYGMPPTGGLGIGIDRLVMLLTDSASIRDVVLFPQMRPQAGD